MGKQDGNRLPVQRDESLRADAQAEPAVVMDPRQVVWSVSWTLNGINLQSVYAERVPQPFTTPQPKAVAAGEKARRFTSQGPGSREQRIALYWPAELLASTALTVHPGDRLSVLVMASYVAAPAEQEAQRGGRSAASRVVEPAPGRLTPRLGLFSLKKKSPAGTRPPPQLSAAHTAAARAQAKRFFTRNVVVQVPERVEVGALVTRATDLGVCYTHADFRSYAATFRHLPSLAEHARRTGANRALLAQLEDEAAADAGEEEEKPAYALETLTIVIPVEHVLVDFRRNVTAREVAGGAGASIEPDSTAGGSSAQHDRIAFEMVRNLDTGEIIHVSEVAERVPSGVSPEAMHWLLREDERALRLVIPFISSTVDIVKCAPPTPLVAMNGVCESGATVRPLITLDRYGHGVNDRRLVSLNITQVTWRRYSHFGTGELPPPLGVAAARGASARAAAGGSSSRVLVSADINSVLGATCTLTSNNMGGIGATVTAYTPVVVTAPALRDAVATALMLESGSFDVMLDEGMTALARQRHLEARARSAPADEPRASSPSSPPPPSAARVGKAGAGAAATRGLVTQASSSSSSAGGEPKSCVLQVSRAAVTLVQSRFVQRAGNFARRVEKTTAKGATAGEPEVGFSLDEDDGTQCRFLLRLNGKLFALIAPSAWHRDVIELVIRRRAQRAVAAASTAAGGARGAGGPRDELSAPSPLLYEPPEVLCDGVPLGIDVPLVGDTLELAPARVDYADGCAVQWWRRHESGALVPIGGAVGPRYRLSADDAYCRLEALCTPFRARDDRADDGGGSPGARLGAQARRASADSVTGAGAGGDGGARLSNYGTPAVSAVHAAALPAEADEEAVKSAHGWEYAKMPVLCASLGAGVPPLNAQLQSLPQATAASLWTTAGLMSGTDAQSSASAGGSALPLESYTCVLSKKHVVVRPPGVLVLRSLVTWPVRPGINARVPAWDKPVVELAEDELDASARRLLLLFDSLEERDQFVLVFHYLVFHGLQVQYNAQAAAASLAARRK
ncbi:hypothetical protein KFE25_000233 [Diacronema lutheri]|uniref:Uncharacterized protein n=1 Tax=Diacronema lutheri TaxID=2081491 RepID=A0A8J5XRH0_DIALT|nr:hypothetical protein KFE25_000233 [Diacronema lutheri]